MDNWASQAPVHQALARPAVQHLVIVAPSVAAPEARVPAAADALERVRLQLRAQFRLLSLVLSLVAQICMPPNVMSAFGCRRRPGSAMSATGSRL
eukprot:15465538-Alexandrium_andersonii.AAC.1